MQDAECSSDEIKRDGQLSVVYILATLGDLAFSVLLTGCILYGNQLGGSQADAGLIGSAYGLTYLITPAILGKLSDKFSRKTSLLIAAICQVGISIFYITLGSSIPALILGQALTGIAYGFYWPNIEAIISEKTGKSPKTHQKGMANFCIAWSIGYMTGPLISGVVSDYQVTIAFIIAALIYGAILLLVIFGVSGSQITSKKNETIEIETKQDSKEKTPTSNSILMVRILFGMVIYAMIGKLIFTYFTDYAVRDDLLDWDGTLTGQIVFIFGIGRTIYFLLSRFVNGSAFKSSITRINYANLIISGFLILIPLNNSPLVIGTIFLVFGFFIGLIYLSSLDLLIVHERQAKGAKAGLFESTIGLGGVISPFMAGILGQYLAFLPFIIFSIALIILFIVNLYLKSKFPINDKT